MPHTITAHGSTDFAPRTSEGHYRLSAELSWLVQADADTLAAVEAALSRSICDRIGDVLLLRFGNAVGHFDGGPLGRIVVHSDKWEETHFDEMLADITHRMALLPFAAGTGAELPYDRSITTEHRVLFHAFVYLRHLLSETAAPEDRLVPALRLILRQPHRRLERVARWTPLHAVTRIEPRALIGVVSANARLTRAPGTSVPLARALRGHVPEQLEETRAQDTVDVPENRFVKAFLGQASSIVDGMRAAVATGCSPHFRARILADCDAIARALAPVRQHVFWSGVSEMTRVPAESQVLQRRRGYREVFRHFVRLRLAARLPLRPDAIARLLEIKDIAELYEIWSFFELERLVSLVLERGPLEVDAARVDDFGAHLGWGLRVRWDGGVELFYNLSYSRSRVSMRSYSLPLRPDVVLSIPDGPSAGHHLFDAKFKLRRIDDARADDVDDAEQAAERRGIFKHADLYKMHTYRDAIATARTVWILYPGTEFRFFDEKHGVVEHARHLPTTVSGVGAAPLAPKSDDDELRLVLRHLLLGCVAQP
jgi:predicted component of viral defense system (DUF524 family)